MIPNKCHMTIVISLLVGIYVYVVQKFYSLYSELIRYLIRAWLLRIYLKCSEEIVTYRVNQGFELLLCILSYFISFYVKLKYESSRPGKYFRFSIKISSKFKTMFAFQLTETKRKKKKIIIKNQTRSLLFAIWILTCQFFSMFFTTYTQVIKPVRPFFLDN